MKYYACIDIGGTAIKVAVLDEVGTLFEIDALEVPQSFEEFVEILTDWVNEKKNRYTLSGLAFSSPGSVNSKTGVVGGLSAVLYIHGPNFKEIFKERTGLNVSIENDANCVALAEVFSGVAKEYKDILLVVCGTGIGGAIIKDGKVHAGANLYGGEIGYMIMAEENGRYINFSRYASTMSFVRRVRNHYQDDSYDGKRVFEEAAKGNQVCQESINLFYKNLAHGLFNLQHIYDPEVIILGGAISNRNDFIEQLNKALMNMRPGLEPEALMPKLRVCTHKKDANLIGALVNFKQEYENE